MGEKLYYHVKEERSRFSYTLEKDVQGSQGEIEHYQEGYTPSQKH